jgi:hypothetical protein
MLNKALTLALALTTSGAVPRMDGPPAFDSPEAEVRAEAVRDEVAAEVAGGADHAWAGTYYWGDGLGANVTVHLAPRAGFVFEWHGCLGLYGRNYGPLRDEGTHIVLEPELANKAGEFAGIDEELLPVAWGARRYLIAAGRMNEFCNAVNEGSEPRNGVHGLFLLRNGDEAKPADGSPRRAEGAIDCLLGRPIEARIVSVGPRRRHQRSEEVVWYETTAVLNAGREHGVWDGMRFYVHAQGHSFESGRVTRVHERSSEAVFSVYREQDVAAELGWRLSTRREP